jgi:hypothetical protein
MNRWTDEFSAYERYIDHQLHSVAYIVTAEGATVLGNKAAKHVVIVPDFKNEAILQAALAECQTALGGVDRLICLSEFDLSMAAQLRAHFAIPGDKPDEVARFRDKTVMKQRMLAAGVRAPRFVALDKAPDTLRQARQLRYPLIVKPRSGAASAGVHKVQNPEQLDALLCLLPLDEYQAEEFIEGPIYHVDGLISQGVIQFQKASRYLGTCFAFAHGQALGSITLAPSQLQQDLLDFSARCLQALALHSGAYHLEIIAGADGLYFLEIGARVGGGEIPFTMYEVFGVDMYQAWVGQQLDPHFQVQTKPDSGELAGFLIVPEPVGQQLLAASVPNDIAPMYAHIVPPAGHVFDGQGGYDTILGRFRYRASNEAEIEHAIGDTLARFACQMQAA